MASILFLSSRLPYPPIEGHQLRTWHLLRALASEHEVHLLCFGSIDGLNSTEVGPLRMACKSVEVFPGPEGYSYFRKVRDFIFGTFSKAPYVSHRYYSNSFCKAITDALEFKCIDIVHVDSLPLFAYKKAFQNRKIVFNAHNVEWELMKQRGQVAPSIFERMYCLNQVAKTRRLEREVVSLSQLVIACSKIDADKLNSLHCLPDNVAVVPNGVCTESFFPSAEIVSGLDIVFVGGVGWFPNKDAMDWFFLAILPLVVKEVPGCKFHWIGKTDGYVVSAMVSQNVILHGFVDDFRTLVKGSAVYVMPFQAGSGTRLKLLEAMALGSAIVTTSIGALGVNLTDGQNALIEDDPEKFAQAIIRLLHDRSLREKLGRSARNRAVDEYSWEDIGRHLLELYDGKFSN